MKNQPLTQSLLKIKSKVDNITTGFGCTIDPEDIILYIQNGLIPNYKSINTTFHTTLHLINLDNFYFLCNVQNNIANEITRENYIANIVDSTLALYFIRRCGQSCSSNFSWDARNFSHFDFPACVVYSLILLYPFFIFLSFKSYNFFSYTSSICYLQTT